MKPAIALVYHADCPNADAARAALRAALARTHIQAGWTQFERGAPGVPKRLLRFGSPTIVVATSTVPFLAIAQGRQRLALGEIEWWRIALSIALFLGALYAHHWAFGVGHCHTCENRRAAARLSLSLAQVVPVRLGAITAGLHRAPSAAAVFTIVEEQP